ncbi:hypothetical protein AVEN_143574-1 [Araneus ventricosus]|uniref:Uncharacterized protein n=1 Tax=Araneus ventricosus TaxID=182803 RepID=A0A4Y2APV0_ARAVE|nr:hypothetical protein AVEN_143574-1 [Araneus ventricosus]
MINVKHYYANIEQSSRQYLNRGILDFPVERSQVTRQIDGDILLESQHLTARTNSSHLTDRPELHAMNIKLHHDNASPNAAHMTVQKIGQLE